MTSHLLSCIIFLPLLFAILILLLPGTKNDLFRYIALASASVQVLLSTVLFCSYKSTGSTNTNGWSMERFQFVERTDWIDLDLGSLGHLSIDYFLGVDGISVSMLLLSSIVVLIGAIASWHIGKNTKGYFSLYLLLSCTIPGCFAALDFFLFYLFFELMLLPMYFLIGMWGGPRREYASIKFFLYTLFGSVFILIALIALYLSVIDPVKTAVRAGLTPNEAQVDARFISQVQLLLKEGKIEQRALVHTFNIPYMTDPANYIPGSLLDAASHRVLFGKELRWIAFLALFLGFAIKMPVVPLHTWLPDAHVEAPTPVSVVLAGILLKVGAYGILRCAYGIFPDGAMHYAWYIGLLGVIAILYGAFNALAMKDIKKMIAYSSVSHMGFVLLGIASLTSEGVNGSIFQMFSHGILSSMLFVITGVLYDRTHDRTIDYYRGLASKMPVYASVVTVAFFASLGLPGFSGFIGELFVLLGAFSAFDVNGLLPKWMAVVATLGLLVGAAYFLWTLQRMFFGKFSLSANLKVHPLLNDLVMREKIMLMPLVVMAIALGLFPGLLFDTISGSVSDFTFFVLKTGKLYLK